MVIWHNIDGVTHRVVLNNGSLDTGDLRPGASSQAMSINGGGGGYPPDSPVDGRHDPAGYD